MKKQYVFRGRPKLLKMAIDVCADKIEELIKDGFRILHFQVMPQTYDFIILYEDGE